MATKPCLDPPAASKPRAASPCSTLFAPRLSRETHNEQPRHSLSTALIGLGCALAIVACGSSGGPSSSAATGSGDTGALEFARCMRSHGVPKFPDPGAPQGDDGVLKQSPAFRSAMQTCNKPQPGGTPNGTRLTEAQRIAALAQARCIRDHGVPNFPDPQFPSTGGQLIPAIPGFNPTSPAFKRAGAACGLRLPEGQAHGG